MKKIVLIFSALVGFVIFMAAGPRPAGSFYWSTAGSNIEPNDNRKANGWFTNEKPAAQHFNWLFNRLGLWIDYLDIYGSNGYTNILHINTQSNFEFYFGSNIQATNSFFPREVIASSKRGPRIPARTIVYLHPITGRVGDSSASNVPGMGDNGTNTFNGKPAYVLKCPLILDTGVKIIGDSEDAVILIRNTAEPLTNSSAIRLYLCSDQVGGGTISVVTNIGGNRSRVVTSSSVAGVTTEDPFLASNNVYPFFSIHKIVQVVDNQNLVVTPVLTNNFSGNFYFPKYGIEMSGFSIDGRGGVNGLGGSQTNSPILVALLAKSKINCQIINGTNVESGGGVKVSSIAPYEVEFGNIRHCFSGTSGGAMATGYKINANAYFCGAASDGGAFANFYDSRLSSYGSFCVGNGGGSFNCDYSDVFNSYTSANGAGGGSAQCDFSQIHNKFCSSGTGGGGGNYLASNSFVFNYNCVSVGQGGGDLNSYSSEINNFSCIGSNGGGASLSESCRIFSRNCVASNNGGGAFNVYRSSVDAYACTAANNGGGLAFGSNNFVQFQFCAAGTNGGGAYQSTNVIGYGIWRGNTATAAGTNIDASASALWGGLFLKDGTYFNNAVLSITDL